ncbi:MAG: hypothetical protein WBG57_04325 [Ornithinimicrobium sp.]
MRRSLIAALAVPVLFLAACGSDDDPSVEEATSEETSEQSSEEATEEPEEETVEETEEPTEEAVEETEEPPQEASGDVEGGEEGAAAAAVTEEFMVALANADPKICDLMLDAFAGSTTPMADSPENLEQCQSLIVPSLEGVITEEQAQIIELIEVMGADVQDDSATVDKDNFSELFAEGFGEETIELKKIDDQWYIDLENSFQGSAAG